MVLIIKGGKILFSSKKCNQMLITKDILQKIITSKLINITDLNINTAFIMA